MTRLSLYGDCFEACFVAAMDDARLPADADFIEAMRDALGDPRGQPLLAARQHGGT